MTAEILFTSCLILHMREESLRGQEPVQGGAANGRVGMRIQAIPGILRYCQSLLIKAERRFFSVNPFTCDILALFADSMKSVNPRDNQEFEPQGQFSEILEAFVEYFFMPGPGLGSAEPTTSGQGTARPCSVWCTAC